MRATLQTTNRQHPSWRRWGVVALTAILLASLVSGCGWRLRGTQSVNLELTQLAVNYRDQYSQLANTLTETLGWYGIEVVAPDVAEYTLSLGAENLQRRSVAVAANGLAAQYELQMRADFRLTSAHYDSDWRGTFVTRIYDYDQDDTIGKRAEEQILLKEMRQEIVNRILRQVNSLSANAPAHE